MTKLIKTKNYHDCDQYLITKDDQTNSIVWQTGTEKEQGVNGLQIVDVIILTIERLLELDPGLSDYNNFGTLNGLMDALYYQIARDGKEKEFDNIVKKEKLPVFASRKIYYEAIKGIYGYECGDTVK